MPNCAGILSNGTGYELRGRHFVQAHRGIDGDCVPSPNLYAALASEWRFTEPPVYRSAALNRHTGAQNRIAADLPGKQGGGCRFLDVESVRVPAERRLLTAGN